MLSFGVSSILFVFSIVLSYIFCLDEVFQVFIKHSLKIMVFSKDYFKVSLCCNLLHYMCYFANLEEV
jgi:hypothetical protein